MLVYNSRYKEDYSVSRKLKYWWLGPYRITEANHSKSYYKLAELDGTPLAGTYAGRRLKLFYVDPLDDGDVVVGPAADDDPGVTNEEDIAEDEDPKDQETPNPLARFLR